MFLVFSDDGHPDDLRMSLSRLWSLQGGSLWKEMESA